MVSKSQQVRLKSHEWKLRPDFIARDVTDIDFTTLANYGITACFIDLDGTVVARGKYNISDGVIGILQNCGMTIYIATNRPKSRDLKDLKEKLGASGVIHPYLFFGKPFKSYFKQALAKHKLQPRQVVMVGDRYFQDILGANNAGMYSLLVHKLDKPSGMLDSLISKLESHYTRRLSFRYFR